MGYKWASSTVLDQGPNYIKITATHMLLIKAYALNDSYATVVANKLADATMTSTDYTLTSSGSNRLMTTALKTATATASSGATPDLHFAFTDGASTVLWVTDETSDQVVTSGNAINFPALTYQSNQPT